MKVYLRFSKSIFNCDIIIKDSDGMKKYFAGFSSDKDGNSEILEVDITSGDFELTISPEMVDYKSELSEMEIKTWKDKLVKKIGGALSSFVDKNVLRVGCKYMVDGVSEGDIIDLVEREYVFGTFVGLELFNLLPVMYLFFEVSCNKRRYEVTDAFALNRRDVLSSSRKLVLIDFGLHLLLTYPIQMFRVKRLTSKRKIKRTVIKFNRMSEEKRQRIIAQSENLIN